MARNIEDFWKILEEIQGKTTDLTSPVKAIAHNEQSTVENFLNNVVDQIAYNSPDWIRIKDFLRDWYASHRTVSTYQANVSDINTLPNDQLDELFRSFGYPYSTLIKDSTTNEPPTDKINFFLDLVNLYKRKGTPQALLDVFRYHGVGEVDLYEFTLQLEERIRKNPNDLIFKGIITTGTSGDTSPVYLPFKYLTDSDPHWLQTEEQIRDLLSDNKINFPSTTPYFAIKPVFDEEAIDAATGILIRRVQDQHSEWENNGSPDEGVIAILPQDAAITILGEITSMLTLYLSCIYVFNKEFYTGAPASDFICYDGTNITATDIIDEFRYITGRKLESRQQQRDRWSQYLDTFTRVISSNFLQTPFDAGLVLEQLNPTIKNQLDNLASSNIEVVGTLLNDLGEWVRNNLSFGFINMSYILFGLDSFFSQMSKVVEFFKPYRARLIPLEQLQFRNRLFNSIVTEDTFDTIDVEQQALDFVTGDSHPCCSEKNLEQTIQPTSIIFDNDIQATLFFETPVTGHVTFRNNVLNPGHFVYEQIIASDTWYVNHSLGEQYVNVEVIDSSNNSIQPSNISFDSTGLLTISFTSPIIGYAAITSGNNTDKFIHNQIVDSNTWIINHSLGEQYVNVEVIDSSNNSIQPSNILFDSDSQLTITFSSAIKGHAAITSGNQPNTTNAFVYDQTITSNTWVINHQLNDQYVNVEVINSSDNVIAPSNISFDSDSQLTITFSAAITGKAAITNGSQSGLFGYRHTELSNVWVVEHGLGTQFVNVEMDYTNQPLVCLDGTSNLYYSRETYDCGAWHDTGAVTDQPENEFIEIFDRIPDRLNCPAFYGDGTAAIYNASNLDAPNAPIVTSNLLNRIPMNYDIAQINNGEILVNGSFRDVQTPGYALTLNLFNTVDNNPIFYSHIITEKSLGGYTAMISGAADSDNYHVSCDYDNSNNSGIVHVPDGTNRITIDIPPPPEFLDSTGYTVAISLSNMIDIIPSCYHYTIIERTPTNFTVEFSGNIDSNNYYLEWILITHEKQDVEDLSLGITSTTIVLQPREVYNNYGLSLELLNESDSTAIIPFIVTDKQTDGFTVAFERPIDSLNYKLMWSRPLNASLDSDEYRFYQTGEFVNFDGVPLDTTGLAYVEGTQGLFDCTHGQDIVEIEIEDLNAYILQETEDYLLQENGDRLLLCIQPT